MKYGIQLAVFCALALQACSSDSVKDTLGLTRGSPDEFRVVSRPPLSVPPQFTLRPPANSDISPNQASPSGQAQALVTGVVATDPAAASPAPVTTKSNAKKSSASIVDNGDATFLKNAGADKANPNIRTELTEEKYAVQEKVDDRSWYNFWDEDPTKQEPVVDPKKESDRIKTTQDSGQPVNTGDTPEVKDKDTGLLGRIFGY